MALAQAEMRFRHSRDEDALGSAERALALDPNLAEALCVKARYLADEDGKPEEADRQIQMALRLEPDSWEVNKEAARLLSRSGKMREAIPYFEKAASLVESDYHSSGHAPDLLQCHRRYRRASSARADDARADAARACDQDPVDRRRARLRRDGAGGAWRRRAREGVDQARAADGPGQYHHALEPDLRAVALPRRQ